MTDKRIRIILDKSQAQRGAKELDQGIKDVGKSADNTNFSINKLAAAIAAVISVQKIVQYADAWARVQNQLARTSKTQEELVATSEQLLIIANQTRSGVESTVELYTSLRVSTESLGVTQEQAAGITKTINNLFLESGKSATESAGAIRQLGQALQSGALRGDEFNSVAEGAPGILRAIELQTGLTRAELRELAAQGQITSELIVKSLQNYSEEAQAAADKTSVTLDQAFTVAGNNLSFFIGSLDDATGASSGLASAIIDLSNYISSPEAIFGLIEVLELSKSTIDSVTNSVSDFSNEIQMAGDIGSRSLSFIGDALKNILPNMKALVEVVVTELLVGFDKLKISATTLFDILSNPFDDSAIRKSMDTYNSEIERINAVREDSLQLIFDEKEAIQSTAEAAAQARIQEANARRSSAGSLSPSSITSSSSASPASSDSGEREIARAKQITATMQNELALRQQVADIYREQSLAKDQSLYNQQLAAIKAKEAEGLAILEARSVEDNIRREEQFRLALENDKIREEEKAIIKQEQIAQQLLAEQITEEQRTAILEQGVKARAELDKAEFQSRLANAGALGNALMQLGQGQSKKIFKIGQTLALAQAAAALPSAVLQSYQNGGGYPWGLIPAGVMLATGLKNIQSIRDAGKGLGGGGGGSVSMPSLPGGGGGGASPQIPNTASTTGIEQKRVIELRGVTPGSLITGDQLASIFEDDDSVVVAFENAREDAARRNVIGVTAR